MPNPAALPVASTEEMEEQPSVGLQVDEVGNLYAGGADMLSLRTDNLRLSTLIEGLPKVSVIIVLLPLIIVLKGEPQFTPFAFSSVDLNDDVTKLAAV